MKTRPTRARLQHTIIGQYCHNSSTEFVIIWQASLKGEWRTLTGRFKLRISQAVTTLSFIFLVLHENLSPETQAIY